MMTDLAPLFWAYLALGGQVSDHEAIDPDLVTTFLFTGVGVAHVPQKKSTVFAGNPLRALTPRP